MRDLSDVLEDFKKMGNYGVTLYYGEDIGCDDLDVLPGKRRVLIVGTVVGYLGGLRLALVGTRDEIIAMHLGNTFVPQKLPNPPGDGLRNELGAFVWGTEENVARYLSKFAE